MRISTVAFGDLDFGLVLTPQRYDGGNKVIQTGTPLRQIATLVRQTISPAKANQLDRIIILDTTHAKNGLLDSEQALSANSKVGSSKKLINVGDVVISRLRPYLRQVAYVDAGATPGHPICGSTEFFVLRSVDGESISFLVPWLLSEGVQQILASSQEGGHHPRFNEDVLLKLSVPDDVLAQRGIICDKVESASEAYRICRRLLREASEMTIPS